MYICGSLLRTYKNNGRIMDTKWTLCLFVLCLSSVYGQNSSFPAGLMPQPAANVVSTGRVSHIGNPHIGTNAGVDKPGVTFLLDDVILREGVVFAYAAYFRNTQPASFQIYRPTGAGDKTFTLISTMEIQPAVNMGVEQIYVESKLEFGSCVRVKQGDRLGVYFGTHDGSVAYAFDPDQPAALLYESPDPNVPVNVSEVVDFTTLVFPYDFSMSAYIDTEYPGFDQLGDDDVFVPCPVNLLIPEHIHGDVSTPAPQPGEPGPQGPPGPQGEQGEPGPQGPEGPQGDVGPAGPEGSEGPRGEQGMVGRPGLQGQPGPRGQPGVQGPQGVKGDKGDIGPVGPAGPAGKTVYVNGTDPNAIPGSASSTSDDDDNIWWIILLIWLIIVTICLIVLIIILCVIRKKYYMVKKDGLYSHHNSDWTSSVETGNGTTKTGSLGSGKTEATSLGDVNLKTDGDDSSNTPAKSPRPISNISDMQPWMGTLKDEKDAGYEVGTISTLKDETASDKGFTAYLNEDEYFPTDSLKKPKKPDFPTDSLERVKKPALPTDSPLLERAKSMDKLNSE